MWLIGEFWVEISAAGRYTRSGFESSRERPWEPESERVPLERNNQMANEFRIYRLECFKMRLEKVIGWVLMLTSQSCVTVHANLVVNNRWNGSHSEIGLVFVSFYAFNSRLPVNWLCFRSCWCHYPRIENGMLKSDTSNVLIFSLNEINILIDF